MTTEDILKIKDHGEMSTVQFKERLMNNYDIGCELVAFSNSHGGNLIVGINDETGEINPLSYSEVQETTNLLGNIASENVVPNILLSIETVSVEDGALVIATIKEGLNKPYHDNKGIVWVKNGADKRKVFDKHDEHKHTLLSVLHFHTPYVSDVNFYHNCLSEESLFKFQSDAILTAAQEGNCVFVVRCADYILRDFERVVNIFITASDEDRIRRVSEREGLNVAAARKFIQNGDNCRSSYYNYYTGKTWGAAESYDLCINSSLLGIDDTELFIKEFIEKKDKKQ